MQNTDNESRGQWVLDRHIPVAFLVGLALQAGGIVWWGSQVTARQDDHERRLTSQESSRSAERMAVLEEQIRASKEIQNDMNRKLDQLLMRSSNVPPNPKQR